MLFVARRVDNERGGHRHADPDEFSEVGGLTSNSRRMRSGYLSDPDDPHHELHRG